ncbi:hypothetical protein [Pseudomonas viridiflava]|uniref:hypothetical protein n=1 Tax=Pseudomonas viridiflava TaxID=33069 RepID=UPI000F040638|nr:hypothetical protein [Pseudomonas viridiflava]
MEILVQFAKVSRELFFTLLFSLFPILCGSSLLSTWTDIEFGSALSKNFSSGEVFIYTSAFLTPYILIRYKESGPAMLQDIRFLLFLYALIAGAFLFVSVRLETLIPIKMSVHEDGVAFFGYTIVIATLLLWYSSIWPGYRAFIDPSKVQSDQEQRLFAGFNDLINKESGK